MRSSSTPTQPGGAPPTATSSPERRRSQSLALNSQYLREVVEAFNLCPWAKSTRTGGRLARKVYLEPSVDTAVQGLSELEMEPGIEVGLLIFSELRMAKAEFDRFVSEVGQSYSEKSRPRSPLFALAAFHPRASAAASSTGRATPDQMVAYARQTPEPTIQAVRMDALRRVRAKEVAGTTFVDPTQIDLSAWLTQKTPELPSLRERITQANWETFRDQQAEVATAYARLDACLQGEDDPPALASPEPPKAGR